jgi:hypothetical protein
MLTVTMTQALHMADIAQTDPDMERDLKFSHWIAGRKYMIITPDQHELPEDVEIFIIKET